MKPTLYLETSVVSYLAARRSRDLVTAARQQLTTDWWETQRHDYDIHVSPTVLDEAKRGDAAAAEERLRLLAPFPVIEPDPEADVLAEQLMTDVPLPERAAADAVHMATAAAAGMTYVLTWNFKHIANPALRERIDAVCRTHGITSPILCTPEDLVEGR